MTYATLAHVADAVLLEAEYRFWLMGRSTRFIVAEEWHAQHSRHAFIFDRAHKTAILAKAIKPAYEAALRKARGLAPKK